MGKTHPREYFVAGGIAGIVSRTAIAPIERVKILYQVSRAAAGTQQGWMQIAPNILRDEGVLAFWKGNTAAVVRVMPYMSLTFLTYEEYKVRLIEGGMPKQASTLAAGSAAGVTAVSVTYPLDLVRATMAKPGHTYSSMFDAMITIVRQRGVGGLYAGISATILGVAPYAGLKFVSCASTLAARAHAQAPTNSPHHSPPTPLRRRRRRPEGCPRQLLWCLGGRAAAVAASRLGAGCGHARADRRLPARRGTAPDADA